MKERSDKLAFINIKIKIKNILFCKRCCQENEKTSHKFGEYLLFKKPCLIKDFIQNKEFLKLNKKKTTQLKNQKKICI